MTRRNLDKVAQELAPIYHTASPADVEDDVSLCLWVRKETGEELTLDQVEALRELMEAEIDRFPKVVIYVSGGVVQNCISNDERLRVFIVDEDNLQEEDDPVQAEAEAKKGSEDCVFVVL